MKRFNLFLIENEKEKFISIVLKIITLLSKFILIFILAKYLKPYEIGIFGLVLATVGIGIYLIGFEFYTFSLRNFIHKNKKYWGQYLKTSFLLYVLLYILAIPIIYLVFLYEVLPIKFFLVITLVILIDHYLTELSRILIFSNNQLKANILLFLKNGLWCIVTIINFIFFDQSRTLGVVFWTWFICLVISLIYGQYELSLFKIESLKKKINLVWLKKGIKLVIPIFLSTLIIKFLFTADKYLINHYSDTSFLAAYVLFFSINSSLLTFIDTAIFQFSYPKLIFFFNKKRFINFKREFQSMFFNTIIAMLILTLIWLASINFIISFFSENVYKDNILIFYFLIAIFNVYILSMVPHYYLFSCRQDKIIFKSHFFSMLIFISFILYGIKNFKELYILEALFLTFCFTLIYKFYHVVKFKLGGVN